MSCGEFLNSTVFDMSQKIFDKIIVLNYKLEVQDRFRCIKFHTMLQFSRAHILYLTFIIVKELEQYMLVQLNQFAVLYCHLTGMNWHVLF